MKKFIVIAFCLLMGINGVHSQSIPEFKDGERVAFVGNSITCGGHYHSYIWLYYMTHFPNRRIDVFNEGVGGDVARQMSQRLDKVFEHKPTVVTLSFGMNDTGYMNYTLPENESIGRKNVETSCNDYKVIEEAYKKYPKIQKVLIGSSPYDETSCFNKVPFPGKNKLIQDISDFLKGRAQANNWGYVDFNRPMTEINKREQQADSTFTLCGGDRIHPTTDGHLVMAYLFLKAQGLTDKPVADVAIDASSRAVNLSENCEITNLTVSPESVSFTYLANSLPFPIDASHHDNELHTQADALNVIPFMDEMNYEGLAVKGLQDGYYLLKIGGKTIARLTAGELKRGVNLASYSNTPQNEQAQQIRQLNEMRWFMEREMREYYWMEYNLMRDKGLLWASNKKAVNLMLENRKTNPFVNMLKDYWLRFMYKSVRDDNENEQLDLVNRIHQMNKPQALKVEVVKL